MARGTGGVERKPVGGNGVGKSELNRLRAAAENWRRAWRARATTVARAGKPRRGRRRNPPGAAPNRREEAMITTTHQNARGRGYARSRSPAHRRPGEIIMPIDHEKPIIMTDMRSRPAEQTPHQPRTNQRRSPPARRDAHSSINRIPPAAPAVAEPTRTTCPAPRGARSQRARRASLP